MRTILFFLFIGLETLSAQSQPEMIKHSLSECHTDSCLISTLLKNKMIGSDDYYWTNGTNTNQLSLLDLQVKISYQNLFGDSAKEAVFELAYLKQLYFLNFFYTEKGLWKKVPGYLYHVYYPGVVPFEAEETHTYTFEEILKKGEYALVIQKKWSYGNNIGTNMNIVSINKHGFVTLNEESIEFKAFEGGKLITDRNAAVKFENKGKSIYPKTFVVTGSQTDCNPGAKSRSVTTFNKKTELSHIKK